MSNVLDLADQALFLGERATGTTSLVQCIWVYDRPVDIDGLKRFHHHLGRGRLARRIERSPLPFGRHRWVSPGEPPRLEIVATPRPREEFDDWCTEQASRRPDAEHGPGWHLAVLPFTDGGAAVSLVITHCLSDGVGLCEADVTLGPSAIDTDLREIRAVIKRALIRHQDVPDERWALLPLVPLIPKRLFRRLISVVTGGATTVVSSNLGVIDPAVNRPDGSDADYFAMKSVYPGVTGATMHRTNGALALLSGRVHGRVFVSVLGYQLGRRNSNEDLRRAISGVLGDFSLSATTGWRTFSRV